METTLIMLLMEMKLNVKTFVISIKKVNFKWCGILFSFR